MSAPKMHLVLVGAGHSHLMVLQRFCRKPIKGLQITVISRSCYIPYSGMIPGLIAGHYSWQQCHISLANLCHRAGARLLIGDINHIDAEQRHITGPQISPIRYDWLSLNTGSKIKLDEIDGARVHGLAAKPIEHFLAAWQQKMAEIKSCDNSYKIAVVGGGAASLELILAIHQRLQPLTKRATVNLSLITAAKTLLPEHNTSNSKLASKKLRQLSIKLLTNSRAVSAHQYGLDLADGRSLTANCVIWATQAGAPEWLNNTTISCDEQGFIHVNRFLQSSSHPNIFAAGDMIHFSEKTLPKSGVYAVRTGQALAKNLHRVIRNKTLLAYKPQRYFLNLISLGKKQALAHWGPISASGTWVWYWKSWLDRRFVNRLNKKD
ncbi:FAD-dependent oxidoreductase [Dasania sp. GY-MA-18]|uniref:FAD-dependent oxidoreductase n=1 Tax=Dasania phycosphaerae TaxID=2950436 RepID=A0A9J6RJC8_9GAMM|nr:MULTISPECIES: FAD-dependent oxidoreductase [Dasania]MCR8921641.1 FAD-dependent oxidoreductase [Dasania sp. GY-MA-18]MCZ0864069.1 FAD-dependent oxidoreductase [Dasania phycosphaerae]MCZ0867797.1 FAD-dependent oxidoreductase [Dasania phycosphaerae]